MNKLSENKSNFLFEDKPIIFICIYTSSYLIRIYSTKNFFNSLDLYFFGQEVNINDTNLF